MFCIKRWAVLERIIQCGLFYINAWTVINSFIYIFTDSNISFNYWYCQDGNGDSTGKSRQEVDGAFDKFRISSKTVKKLEGKWQINKEW